MLGNDVVITDAQVAEVYFQCLQKEKKRLFLTLVHLSLLSAFASRVDAWIYMPLLPVVCLLTIIHMVAICKKYPFITKVLYLSKDRWWRGPCQTQSYKISSL